MCARKVRRNSYVALSPPSHEYLDSALSQTYYGTYIRIAITFPLKLVEDVCVTDGQGDFVFNHEFALPERSAVVATYVAATTAV